MKASSEWIPKVGGDMKSRYSEEVAEVHVRTPDVNRTHKAVLHEGTL